MFKGFLIFFSRVLKLILGYLGLLEALGIEFYWVYSDLLEKTGFAW